jgi:hypothetical protein
MDTDTEYLKKIAEEIVASPLPSDHAKTPNHHLEKEAKRLEKNIIHNLYQIENDTQRDTFHFNTIRKLVNICDILFAQTSAITPNVQVLLDLLTNVKAILPTEIRPNTKLPKAFVQIHEPKFIEAWNSELQEIRKQEIDGELIELAAIPFKRFKLGRHPLYWGDFTWLKGYQAKLNIMDWEHADCSSKSEALISLLIGRDFNDERFYIYCKKFIQARMAAVEGKRLRLNELALCEKLVQEDTQIDMPSFDVRANSVSTRLLKWIKEEIDYVETHEKETIYSKFVFKWSVEMIACFFKLLHERKIFGNIKLERFSEVIAANCTSMDKDEIQASTVYSRFYKKDIELLQAVRKILKDLLDDLDNLLS